MFGVTLCEILGYFKGSGYFMPVGEDRQGEE